MGGFWKEDKLIPNTDDLLRFGGMERSLSLFEMMDVKDGDVLACMDNYHVSLIALVLMADADIMKFRTGLWVVMLFIQYEKDKKKLAKVFASNEARFRELERRASNVINTVTNIKVKFKEGDTKVDMCQAIQDIMIEERKIGEKNGNLNRSKEAARNFYWVKLDIEKVAKGVEYAVETVKQWLDLKIDCASEMKKQFVSVTSEFYHF